MVVPVGVLRRERVTVDHRRLADEDVVCRRMGERVDRAMEALRREMLCLAAPRPEAGAPEQPLGLLGPERPV